MPLPTPIRGEKRDKFISRCMGNKQVQIDFKSQSQRSAVCFSRFKKK